MQKSIFYIEDLHSERDHRLQDLEISFISNTITDRLILANSKFVFAVSDRFKHKFTTSKLR